MLTYLWTYTFLVFFRAVYVLILPDESFEQTQNASRLLTCVFMFRVQVLMVPYRFYFCVYLALLFQKIVYFTVDAFYLYHT